MIGTTLPLVKGAAFLRSLCQKSKRLCGDSSDASVHTYGLSPEGQRGNAVQAKPRRSSCDPDSLAELWIEPIGSKDR
jgi:hypothetical protein